MDIENILRPVEDEFEQDGKSQADNCEDEPALYGCKDSSLLGLLLGFRSVVICWHAADRARLVPMFVFQIMNGFRKIWYLSHIVKGLEAVCLFGEEAGICVFAIVPVLLEPAEEVPLESAALSPSL